MQAELGCTIPQTFDARAQKTTIANFRGAMSELLVSSTTFAALAAPPSMQLLEWAFVMVKTRSFDFVYGGGKVTSKPRPKKHPAPFRPLRHGSV